MPEPSNQIRDRACDWLAIGPVVGFTSHNTSRVLAQPFADREQHELRIAKAAPGARFDANLGGFGPVKLAGPARRISVGKPGEFNTMLFEIDGLEPGTRYFYEVVPRSAPQEVAGLFASRQPYSFRTMPETPKALKFCFLTCNGVHKPPRNRKPMAMWTRLVRESLGDPDIALALLGGDQVYADVIREEWMRDFETDFDPTAPNVSKAEKDSFNKSLAELPERYERIYRSFWRRPEIRTFMGHMPCLMTWDDHEIYDGWGSYGDEGLPGQQGFFAAAAKAFDAFNSRSRPRARSRAPRSPSARAIARSRS